MSRLKLTYWQRRRLRRQLKEATDSRPYRSTLAVLEPDPEREKKTADPAADPDPAAPQRGAGSGRDRPPAVPAPEGRLGAAGRTGEGLAGRGQRQAGGLRRDELGNGDATVLATAQGA